MSDRIELSFEQRATWGVCPTCSAADSIPCVVPPLPNWDHDGTGAHVTRMNRAPQYLPKGEVL